MPVLDPSFIGTWYYYTDAQTGQARIFESFREANEQELSKKPLLQGDIGTHVLNAGGIKHTTSISTPVIIFEDATGTQSVASAFTLLKDQFNIIRDPLVTATAPFLLKSGSIKIAEEGVTCDMDFVSTNGGIFTPIFGLPPQLDFIGRVARFYDTVFNVTAGFGAGNVYQVVDGDIKIDVDIKENYFINTGQYPFFAVQGYQVTGTVKVLALPIDNTFTIAPQNPGDFTVQGFSTTSLAIGREYFNFGEANLNSTVERNVSPDAITTLNIAFQSYVRYTTNIDVQ